MLVLPPEAAPRNRWEARRSKVWPSGDSIGVRGNLDQAAVGIAAIDRPQRAARALLGDRAFLDHNPVRPEMRDHIIRRARGEEAEVVAAGGFVVGSEPVDLVGVLRPHVDLLVPE